MQADKDAGHGLISLLEIEAEAREAQTLLDLHYIIANQTPKLTKARQVFVFRCRSLKKMQLVAITGLASVDHTVPLIHLLERLTQERSCRKKDMAGQVFDTLHLSEEFNDLKKTYPFHAMCWQVFTNRHGDTIGGMLLARENEWSQADLIVAGRLKGAFQHAWAALKDGTRFKGPSRLIRPWPWLLVIGCLLAMAIPVPMATLSPMEIIPADPFIVAAPIDGVIKKIEIEPNARVAKGDLLVSFENTAMKNQLELAEREVLVASARLKQATQLAFSDQRGRHDLGIARAQLALKTAERDYARDLAGHTRIMAERAGIAIFSNKNDLMGKPMVIGERIMQIANPDNVKVRINIPVGDSLILKEGAAVTLYLDQSPLDPVKATIIQADFEAKKNATRTLSYKAVATIDKNDRPLPRLGVRGTAQIFGDKVSLGFYLFRKPISTLRQWIGI